MSLSAPDDHDGRLARLDAPSRPLDLLGELADRIGVSVPALVVAALATCVGAVVAYRAFVAPSAPPAELTIPYATVTTVEADAPPVSDERPAEFTVHAAGAVRHPGVYVLDAGARVADLVAAAGGPLPDADLDRVNLAAPVVDGARIYVPAVGQDLPPPVVAGDVPPASGSDGASSPTVDLNRADARALEALPGIGPATAAAIVDHRERNGPFRSVDDLLAVRGIGDAKLAGLRDLVHVG